MQSFSSSIKSLPQGGFFLHRAPARDPKAHAPPPGHGALGEVKSSKDPRKAKEPPYPKRGTGAYAVHGSVVRRALNTSSWRRLPVRKMKRRESVSHWAA